MKFNGTQYITQKEFKEIIEAYDEADHDEFKRRLQVVRNIESNRNKRLLNSITSSTYFHMDCTLTRWHDNPGNYDFTKEEVMKMQDEMKEFRKKNPNIRQSEMENWKFW